MEYSISEVIFLEVKKIPPALLAEMKEFMRLNVIHAVRSTDGEDEEKHDCHFSGFFSKKSAEKVEKWLGDRGFHRENQG